MQVAVNDAWFDQAGLVDSAGRDDLQDPTGAFEDGSMRQGPARMIGQERLGATSEPLDPSVVVSFDPSSPPPRGEVQAHGDDLAFSDRPDPGQGSEHLVHDVRLERFPAGELPSIDVFDHQYDGGVSDVERDEAGGEVIQSRFER